MKEKTKLTPKERLKKYYPVVIIAVCVLMIGGVYLYTQVFNQTEIPVAKNPETDPPIQEPVEPGDGTQDPTDPSVDNPEPTWVLPVETFEIGMDYSQTEFTFNQTLKEWAIHQAIDFIVEPESDVFAVGKGVIESIDTTVLKGTTIVIAHANNVKSVYSSLSSDVAVNVGDNVEAGDLIGKASDSGYSEFLEGAHVHFEMFVDGEQVDPRTYLDIEV